MLVGKVTVRFLVLGILVLASVACSGKGGRPDSVLLITLDTFRADHLSCYGRSPVETPRLDELAARGVRVENVWTTVPLTTPAHASIMSGLYPMSHGVRNNARFRLPDDVRTLAEILSGAGRKTGGFVGSFTTNRIFGLAQGFDTFDDDMGRDDRGEKRSQRRGDQVVEAASRWLKASSADPFFLWVHLYDAHTPYDPPPPFRQHHPGDPYSGEVAFVDDLVGRLMDALKENGAQRRTVVAVVGDHGEGLGDHGEPEHGFLLYEPMLHVPMILAAPGIIPPGTVNPGPAEIIDLLPTVLGILNVKTPGEVQGVDLLGDAPPDRSIYAETLYPYEENHWSALYALRRGSLKYIESPKPELYDLSADPGETRNLAADRPMEVSDLKRALQFLAGEAVNQARLAAAAGLGSGNVDDEALDRLESLGYVGGGLADPESSDALPAVGGRNPVEAMQDEVRLRQAGALIGAGRFQDARRILAALRAADPENPQVQLKLARATEKTGDDPGAERLYRSLVDEHPTFYLGFRSFSDFLESRDRPLESRDLWLRLAERLPGYVGSVARIARAENKAGRFTEAEARMRAHLQAHPDDSSSWVQLGRALAGQDNQEGAMEALRKALDLQPSSKEALDAMLEVLLYAGRDEEARSVLRKLLETRPDDPVLRRYLKSLETN